MTQLNKSRILCGPRGCGKTFHSKAIAEKLGLNVIVDDWDFGTVKAEDHLYITSYGDGIFNPRDPSVLSFKKAMEILGIKDEAQEALAQEAMKDIRLVIAKQRDMEDRGHRSNHVASPADHLQSQFTYNDILGNKDEAVKLALENKDS